MTSVPWIRLYTSWPSHRKTMALRRELGTADPILALWCWAAENAPDGDLSGLTAEDLETACGWRGETGKAVAAMVQVGFLDAVSANGSPPSYSLHEWADHTGAGIASLQNRRKSQRELMRARRGASPLDPPPDPDQSKRESKSKSKSAHVSAHVSANGACTEPGQTLPLVPAEPPVLVFPCDGDPQEWGLSERQVQEWGRLYQSLGSDGVLQEARKALAWVHASPDRRKTARGMLRFLVGWLGKAVDGGKARQPTRPLSWQEQRDAERKAQGDAWVRGETT